MSDKTKSVASLAPKNIKTKHPSKVGVTTTSRTRVPLSAASSSAKEKPVSRDGNPTTSKQEGSMPDFDAVRREVAYGRFLRTMLESVLVDEKIEREETQMDVQLSQLLDRCQSNMNQMYKTSNRLKDIKHVVEQKRLLDLKKKDCAQFYELMDKSKAQDLLNDVNANAVACLGRLETKNIDFGYDKESGHKQLLDAVNEATEGLEQLKKQSNLDVDKFQEYEKSERSLVELGKDRLSLDNLRADFEEKFPLFTEKLLLQASEQIAKKITDEGDDDE